MLALLTLLVCFAGSAKMIFTFILFCTTTFSVVCLCFFIILILGLDSFASRNQGCTKFMLNTKRTKHQKSEIVNLVPKEYFNISNEKSFPNLRRCSVRKEQRPERNRVFVINRCQILEIFLWPQSVDMFHKLYTKLGIFGRSFF